MRLEELMLGDLVYWTLCPGEPDERQVYDKVTKTYFSRDDGFIDSRTAPIPITPEFLEKNRFKDVWKDSHFQYKDGDSKFSFYRIYSEEPNAWYAARFGKKIHYVHELQHLIKMLEFEIPIKP